MNRITKIPFEIAAGIPRQSRTPSRASWDRSRCGLIALVLSIAMSACRDANYEKKSAPGKPGQGAVTPTATKTEEKTVTPAKADGGTATTTAEPQEEPVASSNAGESASAAPPKESAASDPEAVVVHGADDGPIAVDKESRGGGEANKTEKKGSRSHGGVKTSSADFEVLPIAASPSAPPPSERRKLPNVLIVTIDTQRADHLGCYGYSRDTSPTIDALAKEALLFENCLAPLAQTVPSHMSLFTAVYPNEHGVVANLEKQEKRDISYELAPGLKLVAGAFADMGYQTLGFVSAEPVKRESGLSRGFSVWSQPPPDVDKVPGSDTNRRILAYLDGHSLERPFFMWIHYFDPHRTYDPPAPFDAMFTSDEKLEQYIKERGFSDFGERKEEKLRNTREEMNLYDGETRFADAKIGEIFDKLKTLGAWDDLVVVLTADHGEGLGQHGVPGHCDIWMEQLHVPLIMRIPGKPPRRVAAPISIVDVLPTLAALEPRLPLSAILKQSTGADVLADEDASRPVYGQIPGEKPVESVLVDGWRYIVHPKLGDMLFNLKSDPFELKNVIREFPDRAESLRKLLASISKRQHEYGATVGAGQKKELSPERASGLGDLGYIDSEEEESAAPKRPTSRPNPADKPAPDQPEAAAPAPVETAAVRHAKPGDGTPDDARQDNDNASKKKSRKNKKSEGPEA